MKTKEFIRRLSMFAGTYGMRVSQSDDYNYITLETDDSLKLEVLCVETKAYFSVNSIEIAFDELPHLAKQEVMNDIIFPYISTPLEKREEEKKYLVEIKTKDATLHLWRATDGSGDTVFIYKNRLTIGQRHFTKKEIESIDTRFLQFAIEVTSND